MNAKVASSSNSVNEGTSPAMILQKTQSGSRFMTSLPPLQESSRSRSPRRPGQSTALSDLVRGDARAELERHHADRRAP